MDFSKSLRVSSSGLTAQRQRLNAISSNIANVNTVRTAEGGPYRRKDVVFEARPETRNFGEILTEVHDTNVQRVGVVEMVDTQKEPLLKYEPDHPEADADGYVAYPDINIINEMTNMIQATRSYEANVSAIKATTDMALSALQIGR